MPFFIVMLQNHQYSPAATSGCAGTSAHETGNLAMMNTNSLRFYTQQGTRHRRASGTATLRTELCGYLLQTYSALRRVRINDTGTIFFATLYLYGGIRIRRSAYNLENLRRLLMEALEPA